MTRLQSEPRFNSPSKLESSCQWQVDPVSANADEGVCHLERSERSDVMLRFTETSLRFFATLIMTMFEPRFRLSVTAYKWLFWVGDMFQSEPRFNSPSKLESSCQWQVDPVSANADEGVCHLERSERSDVMLRFTETSLRFFAMLRMTMFEPRFRLHVTSKKTVYHIGLCFNRSLGSAFM